MAMQSKEEAAGRSICGWYNGAPRRGAFASPGPCRARAAGAAGAAAGGLAAAGWRRRDRAL
jgi:hypothetical protein